MIINILIAFIFLKQIFEKKMRFACRKHDYGLNNTNIKIVKKKKKHSNSRTEKSKRLSSQRSLTESKRVTRVTLDDQ